MSIYEDNKKEFLGCVKKLSGSYSSYQVFSDFCELAAISLYQVFAQREELENKYLSIVSKYKREEALVFSEMLAYVVNALSSSFGDFLGECYMSLEISNKHQGQFFTPYSISLLMSSLLGSSSNTDKNGKESFSEPAVGSGGIVIARAEVLMKDGVNYQEVMEVQAVDTDKMCFHMCYIHLTLLHISAEVIWGNSLSLERYETWYTPANIMNGGYRGGFVRSGVSEVAEDKEIFLNKVPASQGSFIQGTLF